MKRVYRLLYKICRFLSDRVFERLDLYFDDLAVQLSRKG